MKIFNNEISNKAYKKAVKGQKKFIKKFGDDRNTEYHLGLTDNPVITGPRGDAFTDSLYKRLLQRDKYSVDEAIAETFDEFTPQMMKVSLKNEAQFYVFLFMTVMLLAGSVLSLLWSIHKTKVPEVYKNAKPCDLTAVYQEPCNFCGGIYIIGMHTECPHCGAALPAHHYMKDEQGNVVQIM